LRARNERFLSDTDLDQYRFNALSLEAQLKVAAASDEQAEGAPENSRVNLDYTKIRYLAPEEAVRKKFGIAGTVGTVIDRKIDPGQTLAAQFQTPELFTVAVGLREKVHILASVDESDIGLIRKAEKE